jgi:ankyrin repeat protein
VVKLLLERGANPSVKVGGLLAEVTPLSEAMYAGDQSVFRLLLQRGADREAAGPLSLALAFRAPCDKCVEDLIGTAGPSVLTPAAFFVSPPLGPGFAAKAFVERGVDPEAKGPAGMSMLMVNVASDAFPLDSIRTLINKGADLNGKAPDGQTAPGFRAAAGADAGSGSAAEIGRQGGRYGAVSGHGSEAGHSIRAGVERSIPLLQRSDSTSCKRRAACRAITTRSPP